MPPRKSQAFDLTPAQVKGQWKEGGDNPRQNIAVWLSNELDLALSARGNALDEIKYCWDYYEQNRMRGKNSPWPDAADLPSPYAPEYTDAIHARLMQTIFVDPVWTVEGYGPSAARARVVEEFHQKAQEEERLQGYIDEWVLNGLVEGVGTLEISENTEQRTEQRTRTLKALLDPLTQQPMADAKGQPVPVQADGVFVDAEETETGIEAQVDQMEPVRTGPAYDVIPYADFLTLPVHARNKSHIWGHAKRFYRRVPQLSATADQGIYDPKAVEAIGTDDESANNQPGVTPPTQEQTRAQKELWEVQLLCDFDGTGERWWRATIHKDRRQLLRLVKDDRTTRYLRWFPFPKSGSRAGSMDRGYSLIGHKLITVIEEDTARRNMMADRMALKNSSPILRMQGALWDPFEQPFGPKAVIDVRSKDDIIPMQGIEDVSASVMVWRQHLRDDGDRLIGQNDTALGVDTEQTKTLGEVKLRSAYAEVRVNVLVKRMQEPLEELGQARHTIWVKALDENPNMSVTRALVIGRDVPGIEMGRENGPQITADLLRGTFWFKPRGSVETADISQARADFNGLMQVLPMMMQVNPVFGAILRTMPAARALFEQMLRVYRWPDRQSFLGSESHDVFAQFQEQQQQQQEMQQLMGDPRMQMLLGMAKGGAMGGVMPQGQPGQPEGPPAPPEPMMPMAGAGVQ